MEIEMIQNEMATGSFGLRNPCKSCCCCAMMQALLNYEGSCAEEVKYLVRLEPQKQNDNFKHDAFGEVIATDYKSVLKPMK